MKSFIIFFAVIGIHFSIFALEDAGEIVNQADLQNSSDSEVLQSADDQQDSNNSEDAQNSNDQQNANNNGAVQNQYGGQGAVRLSREQARHDIIRNMTKQDRLAYLNAERMALRADLLRRYAFFQQNTSGNGYVRSVREGEDQEGNFCRQLEADLILNLSRQYFQAAVCEIEGQWIQVSISQVRFSDSRQGLPQKPSLPGRGKGGWLPPLRQ